MVPRLFLKGFIQIPLYWPIIIHLKIENMLHKRFIIKIYEMARINLNIPNRWDIKFMIGAQERTVNRSPTIFVLLKTYFLGFQHKLGLNSQNYDRVRAM